MILIERPQSANQRGSFRREVLHQRPILPIGRAKQLTVGRRAACPTKALIDDTDTAEIHARVVKLLLPVCPAVSRLQNSPVPVDGPTHVLIQKPDVVISPRQLCRRDNPPRFGC